MSLPSAYVAGLVDGEGCIYLTSNRRASNPRKKSWNLAIDMGMTLPAKSLLVQLQEQFGGSLNRSRKATESWAEAWAWRINGEKAGKLLQDILPDLIVKKEQAELALAAESIRLSLIPPKGKYARWTEEASGHVKAFAERIQELNQKGPEIPMDRQPFALRVGGQWVTLQRDLFGEAHWEPFSGTWPDSGMSAHGVAWTVNGSESPRDAAVCSLSDILEPQVDSKYFLSPKACKGILRRAETRGKTLPEPLRLALEAAAFQGQTERREGT